MPGLDGTGKLFKPFLNALPLNIRTQVIVYPPDQLLSLSEYALLVEHQLPPGRIVLLAESFSGPVALTLLSKLKKAVETVIFCASFAEPPRPLLLQLSPLLAHAGPLLKSMPDFLLRRFCLGSDTNAEQLALVRDTLATVPPKVLSHRLKLITTHHSFLQKHFKIPCHFFQATNDRLVPANSINWFRNHFKPFQLKRLTAAHFLLQVKPWECAKQITGILNNEAAKKEWEKA